MKLFLSCVSSEFRSYRLKLANQLGALKHQPYEVKVQEDFTQGGFTLLDKLAEYIRECDLVIHLVGDACGARPSDEHVRALFDHLNIPAPSPLPELSYTQWEYALAQRFVRPILCYIASETAPRDCVPAVQQPEADALLQRDHRTRIEASGKHYETFSSHAELARRVFFDLHLEADLKINNLPDKSLGTLFKGREEFLAQLHHTLGAAEHLGHQRAAAITATATAATIHGLGGIGKTRAAIEYAHRYADEYTALLFVQADPPSSLQQNLASLCGPMVLDLVEKDARETEVQVAAVLDWLQRHPGWFLILDNVDTEEAATAVQALLARLTRAGQVVITSRLSQWEGAVETLALDVLTVEDAAAFLLERTERGNNKQGGRRKQADDPAQARVLAVELGQLALALEQAGAYIVRYKSTFARYMDEWRQRHERVLEWFDERTMQYPRSVAITWQTSFDRLTGPARQLLRLLSWLAPDPIPESLLEAGGGPFATNVTEGGGGFNPRIKPTESKRALASEELISSAPPDPRDALAELADHSLVQRSDDEPLFSVHRLVQDVTRRTLPEAEKLPCLKQALQWINDAFEGDPEDVRNWPVLEPLAPHARAVAAFADQQNVPEPTAILMNQAGLLLKQKVQFVEAESLMRRALEIDENSCGPEHPAVAIRLNNLAALLLGANRLDEAEPLMQRALEIDERCFGPDHHSVARDLNNLAMLFQTSGRLDEAEPLMRRALEINERCYGPDHPEVAARLNNLAGLLYSTKRLSEAEPLFRRALEIWEKSLGSDHANVATVLNNLAGLFLETNRLAEAETMYRRALVIDEQSYGPDHPIVANRLSNLAGLLLDTKRLVEAETMYRRALVIDEQSFGPDHPNVAIRLNNLALLLKSTNRLNEAESLYRRALTIWEQSLGPDHPNVVIALDNLVNLLEANNRLAETEPLMQRLLAIDERRCGPDDPEVAIRLNNLSQLFEATNRLTEAEPLMRRMVVIFRNFSRTTGRTHPHLLEAISNYVELLDEMGRSREQIQATLRELVPEVSFA
jgi:tetratricopeptide (TPR) repeat protein